MGNSTVWKNSSQAPSAYTQAAPTGSHLVRLVEDPDVKKKIQFDEISVVDQGVQTDFSHGTSHKDTVGVTYPIIRINDTVMPEYYIKSMEVDTKGFIPQIRITLKFPNTVFITKDMPKDGDMISLFMRSDTDAINYLRDDFIVTNVAARSLAEKGSITTIMITGKLFLPYMESDKNIFGIIGTSKDVLRETAKKFGMGFAYNDTDAMDDFQNWICCGSAVDFIEDVTRHAWKNNTSFFRSWIDLYYNICYVNVNKFLLSDENTEDEVDVTFASMVSEYQNLANRSTDSKDARMAMKIFANDQTLKGSPFYISSWKPSVNTGISFKYGYTEQSYVFLHNPDLFKGDASTYAIALDNIPAYDQNKMDTHMIMRGRARYNEKTAGSSDLKRVNYDMAGEYTTYDWTGVEYAINDSDKNKKDSTDGWTGNVHLNYNRAPEHNDINNAELNKMYIEIVCDGLCLQVMKGERIPVIIYQYPMTHPSSLKTTGTNSDNINRMYSGFYVVDSITYAYTDKAGENISRFSTKMILKRREWPTPEMIQTE